MFEALVNFFPFLFIHILSTLSSLTYIYKYTTPVLFCISLRIARFQQSWDHGVNSLPPAADTPIIVYLIIKVR